MINTAYDDFLSCIGCWSPYTRGKTFLATAPVLSELVPEQDGSHTHFNSEDDLLQTIKPPRFPADAMKVISYWEDFA